MVHYRLGTSVTVTLSAAPTDSPDIYDDIEIRYVRGDGDVRYDIWSEMSYSYGIRRSRTASSLYII